MKTNANSWTRITGDPMTMPEQGRMVIIRQKHTNHRFGYHDGQTDGKDWWIWYECTAVRYDSETRKVMPAKEEAIDPPTHWRPIG